MGDVQGVLPLGATAAVPGSPLMLVGPFGDVVGGMGIPQQG